MSTFLFNHELIASVPFKSEWHSDTASMDLAEFLSYRIPQKRGDIAAFAKKVGVSPGQITNILAGRRLPPLDSLDRWISALQMDSIDEEVFVD